MQFKLFQKKEVVLGNDDESHNMIPATPKMKIGGFSIKAPTTPTLTDGSLRGEQKRTGLLESQLKEISLTASRAYDKIEDLTSRNKMLEDQVQQQKEIIESFTVQLEEANSQKKQFKQMQEDAVRNKLEERSHDAEKISKLVHERDIMSIENKRLKDEIEKVHQMYNDNSAIISELQKRNERMLEPQENEQRIVVSQESMHFQPTQEPLNSKIEEYIKIIHKLENEIKNLQSAIKTKDQNYQRSIITLKQSMDVLSRSKNFLDHPNKIKSPQSTSTVDDPYGDNVLDRGDGDTYILKNISFH